MLMNMNKKFMKLAIVLGFFLLILLISFSKLSKYPVLSVTRNNQDIIDLRKNEVLTQNYKIIYESGSMSESFNEYWWLNSGGKVFINGNSVKTIHGELDENDPWRIKYNENNPTETDNGYHPQNIFRLVTREKYKEVEQSVGFKINKYILSADSHRAASNGVLFFHHYLNGNNLYYAGFRVDGNAVIKKKINGIYYTMVYKMLYPETKYNRDSNPNLLPINKWIGLKTVITNLTTGGVEIRVYTDKESTNEWILVAQAIDDGTKYGGASITDEGYAGIRTDFMDVEFNGYVATSQ